jgi:hypothetical protein
MAKTKYTQRARGLNKKSRELLEEINKIIDEYLYLGYKLTVRQLFYQLVSKNIIKNTYQQYRTIANIITNSRMEGLVDWDIIEDRTRIPKLSASFDNVADALDYIASGYRVNRMEGQSNYIEVWCEKNALSGIISKITLDYHILYQSNNGFSSLTALHDAAERLKSKECTILYVGDFDPSGLMMEQNIRSRFNDFKVEVNVKRIALTFDQVQKYQPPENMLNRNKKGEFTDPRSKDYVALYGNRSWECDALKPDVLDKIIREEIETLIDMDIFRSRTNLEDEGRNTLENIADQVRGW